MAEDRPPPYGIEKTVLRSETAPRARSARACPSQTSLDS